MHKTLLSELFSFFLKGYYFRQREIWQAADFTPSKIIDWQECAFAVLGNCRTFVPKTWNDENIKLQIALKREETPFIDTLRALRNNKNVKSSLLECTLKGYDHISDLLLAKYWVITGCKYEGCNNLKSVTSLNPTPPATDYWNSPFTNHDATLYVPFGAKTAYSEANNWKNFTNIEELVYELTDGEEYNEASDKTVNTLTYTRTLPNLHWNALYVPIELPYEVITDRYDVAYINDVNGYDTDGNGTIDDLAMEIITIKGGTLKANYPYLIKAKTEADKAVSITVEDATLYAAEENAVDCSSVYQNYVVKGTYTKKTAEELAGKLAISTSGAWQPLAEGTALNPFRLYLSIENRDNSPLKVEPAALSRMRIVERGETTGIEEVVPSQQREDVIFDLSGRRVKQAVKGGVYIVNGKKRIL